MDQSFKARLYQVETQMVKMERRVRQGWCLSLILFNFTRRTLPRKLSKGLESSK